MSTSTIGVLAALGSTASWALCGVLFKRLGERLDPVGMTVAKSLVAAAILFSVAALAFGWFAPDPRQYALLAASGIVGVAIGDSFFFAALARLSPLALAVLLLAGPDIFSGVLGILLLGEMPSWKVWSGILVIMVAMCLLMWPERGPDDAKSTVRGIVYGLLALACTALGSVIAKPALTGETGVPTLEATAIRMAAGGAVLAVFGLVSGRCRDWLRPLSDLRYAAGFVGCTALVAFGGFWLSLTAISRLEVVTAGALLSIEPVYTLPFMILFAGHRTCVREVVGMVLAVIGVVTIAICA